MKTKHKTKSSLWRGLLTAAATTAIGSVSQADILPSDPVPMVDFGTSVSIQGQRVLGGRPNGSMIQDEQVGLAYYFAPYNTTPNAILYSNSYNNGELGTSVSLFNDDAVVGAPAENRAYYYYNLDSKIGFVSQTRTLLQPFYSGETPADRYGTSVSLFEQVAIVGAPGYNSGVGAIYYHDQVNQNGPDPMTGWKLGVSDPSGVKSLGSSVSTNGFDGLAGAPQSAIDDKSCSGAAFFYRHLQGRYKFGFVESAKLIPSDPSAYAYFGESVSLSGQMAAVGAPGVRSVYLYMNPSFGDGLVLTEDAKLTTQDLNATQLGKSVSLAGNSALVGAPNARVAGIDSGAAYYYPDLDQRNGTVYETLILYPSYGLETQGMTFGSSVSLDGDLNFAIGEPSRRGSVFRGNIQTFTKFDNGNASAATDGISFVLKDAWWIGGTTNNNTVTLSAGDTAEIEGSIVIGWDGSNDNTLIVEGTIENLPNVYLGNSDDSYGNTLVLENPYSTRVTWMALCGGSKLKLRDFYPVLGNLITWLDGGTLAARNNETGEYETVTYANCESLLEISFDGTYAVVSSRYNDPAPILGHPTLGEPSISGGTVTINASGRAGNYYVLYASTNLLGDVSSWTQVSGTTGQIASDGTTTVSFPKNAVGVEFYRMVVSTSPYTGSLNADSVYSTNVVGRYDVTIPAGKKMLVGRQLLGAQNKVSQLFTALPRSSTVTVSKNGQFEETERHRITGAWSSDAYTLEDGEAAQVYNAGTSAVTITFTGEVVTSRAFNMGAGKYSYACSIVPVALTSPENMGYVRGKEDVVNKYENDVYVGYGVHRITGQWSSGAPSFKVGEGMLFQLKTAQQWTEIVSVDASSLKVSRIK